MTEKESSYLEILTKMGHVCEVRKVNNKNILIVDTLPPNSEHLLELISEYKRYGMDCFEATESEINKGKANGCFINMSVPRHVFPALNHGETFVAYDDPLGGYDLVIFSGTANDVSNAADDFYSIYHPYGKGFVFQKTTDG